MLLRYTLVLLMMFIGGGITWAQEETDYSGVYYIGTVGYKANTPTSNFYLCPTVDWCSYKATNDFEAGNANPFLTTHKYRASGEDATNAVWIIDKAPNSNYYYIKHRKTKKYLVSNGQITGAGIDRMRVHLESIADADLADQGDKVLFDISPYSNYFVISPCAIQETGTHDNFDHSEHRWLTVNGGNDNSLKGASGKTGGPTGYTNTKGIVGIFTKSDVNAPFYLEDYILKPTITYNTSNEIEITVQSDATIIYTTDGTNPTLSNGTVVNDNTISIAPTADGTIIKAVAVVEGKLSKQISTFTMPVLCGSEQKRLIQSQNNGWTIESTTDFHFYMIPGDLDENNIRKVNTTSLFRPTMEWYFLSAGVENGVLYYYIVNNSAKDDLDNPYYLCYDGTNKVHMDVYTNDPDDNKFKFKIVESPTLGTYNIYPYGENILINKDTHNAKNTAINTVPFNTNNANSGNTRWKFVLPTSLDKNAPFTVSDPSTNSYNYYKIANVGSGHFIIPGTPAVTSNSTDATIVNTMNWYFEVAQAATDADWCTYYHIRNASTGQYLYFNKDGNNAGPCLEMHNTIESGNEDRYMFTWAKTADTNVDYYIIPKNLKDVSLNQFSALRKHDSNTSILTNVTRGADKFAWTFDSSTFTCAQPAITWSTEDNGYVITSTESDAKIYYSTTLGAEELTLSNGTLYTGAISVADLGVESVTIRAIAVRKGDGSDASTEASKTVGRVETPTISTTEDGKVQLACTTEGASIFYEIGNPGEVNDPTIGSTPYGAPIEGAAGKVIKAIAVMDGWINSAVATSETITFACATPVIRKTSATTFTIECNFPTSGVQIYYTTDEGTPTTSSTLYNGEVTYALEDLPFTIKAIAVADNYTNSEIATKQLATSLIPDVDGYYEISSELDFSTFIDMVDGESEGAGYKYKITKDIDASGTLAISKPFTGELMGVAKNDGTFPTISGLSHPIFYKIDGGVVKNIILQLGSTWRNGDGQTHAGAIANVVEGTSDHVACIYNCGILSGSVSGSDCVGSLVGLLGNKTDDSKCYARIINCFSYATVGGGSDKGGIVGYNSYASKDGDIRTMVMNCLFLGSIADGNNVSPVYGGVEINNLNGGESNKGLNTYNYYRYATNKNITADKYNCALAVKDQYLTRFEIYRQLLNSNRKLAAWYATGDANKGVGANNEMAKWVLDRTVKPYPILKAQKYYPSIINYDPDKTFDKASGTNVSRTGISDRNKGKNTGTVTVHISAGSYGSIKSGKAQYDLQRTDKDYDSFNFNYDKVQLPYFNEVGTGNYGKYDDKYRVVTGWKITGFTGGTQGSFSIGDDVSFGENGKVPYNFADRKCTNKDKYSVSGRVFSQGAYFDVPYGVTDIYIEAYWGQAAFICDSKLDVAYKADYTTPKSVTEDQSNSLIPEGATIYTAIGGNSGALASLTGVKNPTVYDYALVLVGNLHLNTVPSTGDTPFTIMSADFDNDNEPDYSLIYSHNNRQQVSPIRFDFLNIPGTAMAQKPKGAQDFMNFSIFKPKGWFEITNTCLVSIVQFEYDNGNKSASPLILQGGEFEQIVSTQNTNINGQNYNKRTTYIHVGSNAYFKEFNNGTHSDGWYATPHVPISATGGDYDKFYLSGAYRPDAAVAQDNAEGYISGGRFGEVAGAGQQQIDGTVYWQIYDADITDFYGGGINSEKPVTGNIVVDIFNSHVTTYCGGPKFGDMQKSGTTTINYATNKEGTETTSREVNIGKDRTVTTNADGCTFGNYYGAGFGGIAYLRERTKDATNPNFGNWQSDYTNIKGNYYTGKGVATDFDYEFFVWSTGKTGGRFYVMYASLSLASTNDVTSILNNCTINNCFYGGGCLGKVDGNVTSTLTGCTVEGSAFGAGYSADKPKVPYRDGGFTTTPSIDTNAGVFSDGVKSTNIINLTLVPGNLNNGEAAISASTINTDVNLNNLGTVGGKATLNIGGNTLVKGQVVTEVKDEDGNITSYSYGDHTGGVFGGGDASAALGNTEVNIETTSQKDGFDYNVYNVFGGGNNAPVGGNTVVNLKDGIIQNHVYGGGNKGAVSGSTTVNVEN